MTIAYLAFQNNTAPANTNKTWNDVRKNSSSLGLVDDGGVSTGWTLDYPVATNAIAGNGANEVGTGDASWVDEAVIMYEGHYYGDDVTWMVINITGLNNAETYDLAFTASQPVDRKTEVRVNGGTSQVLNADAIQKQTGDVIFFNGVSPSSGQITIEYRSVTGSSAYIMAGYIEEVVAASDTTPPTFTSAPAVTATTDSGHGIAATLNEAGTVYGIRMTNGATPPADDTEFMALYDGGVTGDVLEIKSAAASNSATLTFSTGSASTAYDYYILAEDDESTPNVQASPTLVGATTAAAQVPGISAITVQKDNVAVQASDWELEITLASNGSEVYSGSSIASSASGVISAVTTTGGSVGDSVRVEGCSPSNEYSFIFYQNLEDIA